MALPWPSILFERKVSDDRVSLRHPYNYQKIDYRNSVLNLQEWLEIMSADRATNNRVTVVGDVATMKDKMTVSR